MFDGIVEDRVLVPFAGDGAGTAPLTWGQKAILQDMRETGWTHNTSGAHKLIEGTVEEVATLLGEAVGRRPALRFRLGTGPDGEPCQVIAGSGELPLSVMTVPDDADPDDATSYTNDLWFSWLMTPFDLYQDWPLKVAVVKHRGEAVYWVLCFNHLVTDGISCLLLMADLGFDYTVPTGKGGEPPVGLLELGRLEQTPRLRQVSDRAMRYWEGHLRGIPPLTFGLPRYPEGRQGKRYWHGRFGSPAAYLAMLAIAQRTGTDTSRVLLAIIAAAIGRAMELDSVTARVVMNNRFRPGFAEAIAQLTQNSVLTLDLADQTVDELVAQTRRALLIAGMHSYYDPDDLERLMARLDDERGYPARISLRINDRRMSTRQATEAARSAEVTMAEIERRLPETFLSWDGTIDYLHEQAFITIEDRPETVYLQLIFDMTAFTSEQVESLLHGIEQIAVSAAFDPAVLSLPDGVGCAADPEPAG
ncbi:MAG: condensation domain-containing protein [Jatrophihabitantaceae bacterium]